RTHMPVAAHHDDLADGDREVPVDVLALRDIAEQPARRALAGDVPLTDTCPESGSTMPMIGLNSVDLPEPFIPTSPQIRPASKVREARSRASTCPEWTVASVTVIAGVVMPVLLSVRR